MGMAEASRYIRQLHKRQKDPDLWPDYLTGLPDKAAILRRLESVYPQIGRYSIAFVRIAGVHPYLIKYGPDRHAEIIQWAAALLKTSPGDCDKCFVGAFNTHDFVMICESANMNRFLRRAFTLFSKKASSFYSPKDLKSGTVLSFSRNGELVKSGIMRLVAAVAATKPDVDKGVFFQSLGRACESLENSGEDILVLGPEMTARNK